MVSVTRLYRPKRGDDRHKTREDTIFGVSVKFIIQEKIQLEQVGFGENPGISLTKRESRLQSGNLVYKIGISFTKRELWLTNGILVLQLRI